MVVEAKRTVIIPLVLSAGTAHLLHDTYNKYNHCQNTTSDHCWTKYDYDECITSKQQAENDLYHDLRDDTIDLHANLV